MSDLLHTTIDPIGKSNRFQRDRTLDNAPAMSASRSHSRPAEAFLLLGSMPGMALTRREWRERRSGSGSNCLVEDAGDVDGLAGDAVADLVAATDPVGHDQILCAGLAEGGQQR